MSASALVVRMTVGVDVDGLTPRDWLTCPVPLVFGNHDKAPTIRSMGRCDVLDHLAQGPGPLGQKDDLWGVARSVSCIAAVSMPASRTDTAR